MIFYLLAKRWKISLKMLTTPKSTAIIAMAKMPISGATTGDIREKITILSVMALKSNSAIAIRPAR